MCVCVCVCVQVTYAQVAEVFVVVQGVTHHEVVRDF